MASKDDNQQGYPQGRFSDFAHGEIDLPVPQLRSSGETFLAIRIQRRGYGVSVGQGTSEPPSILVLEDDESTLKLLVRVLEKEGYRVHAAANGEEGMRLFREKQPDLILTDFNMSLKDGLTVFRETKGAGADVEVILVSGAADEDDEDIAQALREGLFKFFKKPADLDEMLSAIREALRR